MSLRDQIKANAPEVERVEVVIEKWGVTAYFKPFNLKESQRLAKKYPELADNPMGSADGIAEALVMKLEDADGNPVFTLEDKPWLMRRPVNEIIDVFTAIQTVSSVEDHEKN